MHDEVGRFGSFKTGLVRRGGQHSLGLVEHDVDGSRSGANVAIVDLDVIGLRIDKDRQAADDLFIDFDAAFFDHGFADPASGDACVGKEALEANFGFGLLSLCGGVGLVGMLHGAS